jgi:serine/threonine-protein kinase
VIRCPADGLALVRAEELLSGDGDPFLGATVAGRFVILGKLGAGSMGTVYRARQENIGRSVAIKILRSDRAFDAVAKARFTREARAMSLLTSPHTVTVFDFGEIPDDGDELAGTSASLYLAMELLEGESLGARLKKRGRLEVEEAVGVARHALLSLAEAHEKGIIHRDLKPDNLFLTRAAEPGHAEICKVLDFGIAKIQSDHPDVDALETQAGTVFGTPRYMSPEQAQGKALDTRSDLYALGVLLYQMLVGRAPFVDEDAVVVMARHIKSIAVPPDEAAPDAGIGEALSRVVMRVLAKDPDDRPASAPDLMAELDRAMKKRAEDRRARGLPARPAAAASGEMTAVVHDDLDALPGWGGRRRTVARSRAMLIVVASASVVVTLGLALIGALRPQRAPVPAARPEIGHLIAARRLAAMQAEATAKSTAEPAAPPPSPPPSGEPLLPAPRAALPAATAAPSAPPPKKPGGKRYKTFDRE